MNQQPRSSTARMYGSLLIMVGVIALALVASVVIVSIQNAQTNERLTALEEYVQGRGEFRDQETVRLEEKIRRSICDLLDQLPEGGLLERPRAKYGCGTGIPLDQLTPDEQARLQGQRPAATGREPVLSPASPTATAPFSGGAAGPPARATEGPVPTRPPMSPSAATNTASPSSTAAAADLEPLTETICDALGVCLEEPRG